MYVVDRISCDCVDGMMRLGSNHDVGIIMDHVYIQRMRVIRKVSIASVSSIGNGLFNDVEFERCTTLTSSNHYYR